MDVIRQGTARATIVIPERPLPVVTLAAEELNYHLERATGTTLAIVRESQAPAEGNLVVLGACEMTRAAGIDVAGFEPNAWTLKLRGRRLFLAGDDSDGPAAWILHNNRTRVGTLFAVYRFVEKQLDVLWLWPGDLGTVVPLTEDVSVSKWDETAKPSFIHTRWRDGGQMIAGTAGWSSSKARSRFISEQGKWLRRHRFAMGRNMDMAHAFTRWWERYAESHPEYFNLLPDGTRRSDPSYHGGSPRLISMSVGNPAFQAAVVEHWLETRTPAKPWIDCSENDTPGKCLCEHCLALDVPDPTLGFPWAERVQRARTAFEAGNRDWVKQLGSLSDRYARYYLSVLRLAQAHDPEVVVMGYAYANYVEPPRNTILDSHVVIGLVPPMYHPWTEEKRKRNRQRWLGWAKTGARLFLRPNWMLDGHNMPLFFARKLGEDFRFFANQGMIGTDFDSLTGQYAVQGPNLYMLARLQTHPEKRSEEVLREYMSGFGPAEQTVSEYFAYLENVADTSPRDPIEGLHWGTFYREAHVIFTPDVMARAKALLERAAEAALGDALAERRVNFLQKGLTNAELTLAVQRAYTHHREHGDLEGYREAMDALDAFRRSAEADMIGNLCFLEKREAATWDRKLLRLMKQPGRRLPDPWRFRWDPDDKGEKEAWWASDCDDSAWSAIQTDRPWEQQNVGRRWKAAHDNADYNGLAWYRTRFLVERNAAKPIARLLFGAVDEACTVWVNGKRLLDRPYPYRGNTDSWQEAFEVDVTDVLVEDGSNTVAVRVSDNAGAGGIWRPVWLNRLAPPVTAENNLVTCPGFEKDTGAWGRSTMAGDFAFGIDDIYAHSGRCSARLQCTARARKRAKTNAQTDVWGRWYRTGITVNPEATYRLRLWIRAKLEPTAKIAIWVTGTAQGTMSANIVDTGGRWIEVLIADIEPKGNVLGLYLNLMHGLGTAWFDDVELVVADGG